MAQLVQLSDGQRLLRQDLLLLRDVLLYGDGAEKNDSEATAGRRLPRLHSDLVLDRLLPFLALPERQKVVLAAGSFRSCVVQPDGQVVCFGRISHGQCDVPGTLGSVVAVAAGGRHTCAVRADGQLACFGSNSHGQCDVPPDLGPVVAVGAGGIHTYALQADGRVVCFGDNGPGQCSVPLDLGPVVALAAGNLHTCVVQSDGRLVCFGHNANGQCNVPADLGPVVSVAAGVLHACAVQADGRLVCFGDTSYGQCDVPPDIGAVVAVSASHFHTCALQADGQLVCFGRNGRGECNVPTDQKSVVAVATGTKTCALQADGQLVCFGFNSWGQCDVPADIAPIRVGLVSDRSSPHSSSFQLRSGRDVNPGVEQCVQHLDEPAVILPSEAQSIVDEQHSSWVAHNLGSSVGSEMAGPGPALDTEMEPLVLLQFSRSTDRFHAALVSSDELEPVRAALSEAGHQWQLPGGATILVGPTQFRAAVLAVAGRVLLPCHILVAQSLEPLVQEVVNRLPSKQKVHVRREEPVAYVGRAEEDLVVLVRRTFLEVSGRYLRAPDSVVQSTTEAMERHAVNPRRMRVED
ncbi:unnamed protein product [Polarella glacialis]|uniref:Uncharacterized protein n=1 Tax=Polarella glacialis TaxID=89957 RepID=A0A813LCE2_POLGL|nr:unnamed protein product [Polarella glacialis]